MKVKNSLIQALVENGLEKTTDHSVDPKYAYQVYCFRREVLAAYKVLEEKRVELLKEAGIPYDPTFDARRNELLRSSVLTDEQRAELDGMNAKVQRFCEMFDQLLDDEVELNIRPIPYEEYHKLAAENKRVRVDYKLANNEITHYEIDFFLTFRDELKDILWIAPKE